MVYVPFIEELAFTMKVEVTEKCEVYSYGVVAQEVTMEKHKDN